MEQYVNSNLCHRIFNELIIIGYSGYIPKIKDEYLNWEVKNKNNLLPSLIKSCHLYNVICSITNCSDNNKIKLKNFILDYFLKKEGEIISIKVAGKIEKLLIVKRDIDFASNIMITYKKENGDFIYKKYFD